MPANTTTEDAIIRLHLLPLGDLLLPLGVRLRLIPPGVVAVAVFAPFVVLPVSVPRATVAVKCASPD